MGTAGGPQEEYESVGNASDNVESEAGPRPGALRPVLSVRQESWERRLRENHVKQKRSRWKRWMERREEEVMIVEGTVLGHRSSSVV